MVPLTGRNIRACASFDGFLLSSKHSMGHPAGNICSWQDGNHSKNGRKGRYQAFCPNRAGAICKAGAAGSQSAPLVQYLYLMATKMIYGNTSVVELIGRAANGGRLNHAYLFYGEKGLGKRAVSAYFAKAILCGGKTHPCGSCPSCKKMDAGAHPDLTVLSGTAEKNELTVANIRKLKADAPVYPNDGERKVYLISDCQRMQAPAANALLKLLEEPPAHLVILLTADDRSHVLPTILSRCIPVGIFPVAEEECAQALEALGGVPPETALRAAAACGGNIGKGLSLLAAGDLPVSPDDFCLLLSKRQEYGMLASLGKISNDKQLYRAFLEALFERFRDAAVLKSGGKRLIAGSKEAAAALIGGFTTKQLLEKIRIVSKAIKDLDANANVPLLSAWVTSSLIGISAED